MTIIVIIIIITILLSLLLLLLYTIRVLTNCSWKCMNIRYNGWFRHVSRDFLVDDGETFTIFYMVWNCWFWYGGIQKCKEDPWQRSGYSNMVEIFRSFRCRWRIVPMVLRPPKVVWSQRPGVQLLDITGPVLVWSLCPEAILNFWLGLIFASGISLGVYTEGFAGFAWLELGRVCRSSWTATQTSRVIHARLPNWRLQL